MSNIASIIDVYKMMEITPVTKAKIMVRLGRAINDEYGMNLTEELVGELLQTLPINRSDLGKYESWLPPTNQSNKDKSL